MKVDLNSVVWNEIMDICIDIEKGQIDHIDGTAKIQEAIEGYLKKAAAATTAWPKGDSIHGKLKEPSVNVRPHGL